MSDKLKYNQSETIIIKRSQINFAPYNPKKHSKEAIAEQKKNIKRVGILGGIVWNKTTGNLISGHKRTMALDAINGYPENDYDLKVEMVSMDEKTEKEQNIYMDASNTNTQQDADLLAVLIPDIDYKNAGLTEEDLNLIGCDFLLQTEEESNLAEELNDVMAPTQEIHEAEKAAKIAHNKEIKAEVNKAAQEKAQNMDAYVMISFDTYEAKADFMNRFGFDEGDKFIKGEVFDELVERV